MLVAALLHDAVEDQPWRLVGQPHRGGPPPTRAGAGGARRALRPPGRRSWSTRSPTRSTTPTATATSSTASTWRRRWTCDPWARVIKVSDFTDNGVGVIHTIGPKVLRAATKYQPLVPLLRELVARPDTPLLGEVKAHIFAQFDLAEERFAAILGELRLVRHLATICSG